MDNTIIGDVTLDSTLLEESVLCNVSCVSSVLEEELDTCDFTLDSDGSSVWIQLQLSKTTKSCHSTTLLHPRELIL